MGTGILEIFLIVFVIVLFVGPRQLPKLTKAVKDSIHQIKEEAGKNKEKSDSEDKEEDSKTEA